MMIPQQSDQQMLPATTEGMVGQGQQAGPDGLAQLPNPAALVGRLNVKLEERRLRRRIIEDEILDAYRRYDGQYDATTTARLTAANRSRLWVGYTSMKCHTALSAVMEFLVGADEYPWDIEPEAVPHNLRLPPQLVQMGITPEVIQEDLRQRVNQLKSVMESQLDDADFSTHLEACMFEMVVTGTGCIKGPITIEDNKDDWQMVLDQQALKLYPQEVRSKGYRPDFRQISILSVFPDMECSNVQHGDGFFEEELMTRGEMIALMKEPGVDPMAVLAVLTESPNGNAEITPEMVQLRMYAGDTDPAATNRYSLVHYYGPVTGLELHQAGLNVPQEYHALQINAHALYCGRYILRARIHKGPIPYYLPIYAKRPGGSPFGKGLPILAKDSQDAINAAARMMLDNAAIASGPLIEANMALMQPGEDPTDIYGWRVFLSKFVGGSSQTQAIRVHDIKAYTPMFIQIINLFRQFLDECTFIPSVTDGHQGTRTTKTATGMSILNQNSNRNMKSVMRNVDNRLIKPAITALCAWNMRFNPDTSILARTKVRAKGVASVMARELQADRLMAFTASFGQQPWFKTIDAARKIGRAIDLPEDELIATDEQLAGMVAPDIEGGIGPQAPTNGVPGPGGQIPRQPSPPQPDNPPRVAGQNNRLRAMRGNR